MSTWPSNPLLSVDLLAMPLLMELQDIPTSWYQELLSQWEDRSYQTLVAMVSPETTGCQVTPHADPISTATTVFTKHLSVTVDTSTLIPTPVTMCYL
jgi:hypothetical protein